ncbi:MAG: hypothetical protein WBV82_23740 [Myxococcaceae bacterium]
MSASCAAPEELLMLHDGELRENRARELREHLGQCLFCQREWTQQQELLRAIAAPVEETSPLELRVAELMSRLPEHPVRGRGLRSRAVWGWGLGALAAGFVLVFGVIDIGARYPDVPFHARGGGESETVSQRVGVSLYALEDPLRKLDPGANLHAQTGLMAAYRNLDARPVYLLLFGVDARGAVHWLQPGYTDPATNPSSVRLDSGTGQVPLPESVVLGDPEPGTLRVYSLVTREPLQVSDIESLPPGQLTAESLGRRWPNAAVTELLLKLSR